MSKEELMKYVNDPFWIRLRWFMFVLFWALWIAMLVGAIIIIIQAPKCTPPEPHKWFKTGPLIITDNNDLNEPSSEILDDYENLGIAGVIYKLPAGETYNLNDAHKEKITKLVDTLKDKNINVILDITANYVNEQDSLFKEALKNEDSSIRQAFVFSESAKPPNWRSLGNMPAFKSVENGQHVLSQFGTNLFDMRMNNQHVKEKFKAVLKTLADCGVKGFRLENSKHFIITDELKDEQPARGVDGFENEYRFYTHIQSTLGEGLGDLLNEYRKYVKNITDNDGFLSVTDDISQEHVYKISNQTAFGIDLPRYGMLEALLEGKDGVISAIQVRKDIENAYKRVGALSWLQHTYKTSSLRNLDASEYNLFMFLLPGVPVTQLNVLKGEGENGSREEILELEKIRASPSLQHGSFFAYTDQNETAVAYTR